MNREKFAFLGDWLGKGALPRGARDSFGGDGFIPNDKRGEPGVISLVSDGLDFGEAVEGLEGLTLLVDSGLAVRDALVDGLFLDKIGDEPGEAVVVAATLL